MVVACSDHWHCVSVPFLDVVKCELHLSMQNILIIIPCHQWHKIRSLHFDMLVLPFFFSTASVLIVKYAGTKFVLTNYSGAITMPHIFATRIN